MPYISVTIGQKLEAAQKEKIKAKLGRLITIIPGKTESSLIVDIQDSGMVYMGGAEAPCAYIDLRVYTKAPGEAKKASPAKSLPSSPASSPSPLNGSTLP